MEVPSIFLNRILSEAAKKRASSLHLSVGSKPVLRIDGKLLLMEKENILPHDIIEQIIDSFLDDKEKEILNKKKELVVVKVFAGSFRFRVNVFFQKNLLSVSFNYISNIARPWSKLNLPKELDRIIGATSGLVIFAGANDSGKTSTITSFIEEVNKKHRRYIVSLENPIEYLFVNKKSIIEQRQIGRDVVSYKEGLIHCLNEDVDLVYVDETFEEFSEIMPYVLELSAGNCLVVLEMNSENSMRVLERMINISSDNYSVRYSLSDVLTCIVAQKLIPHIGGGLTMVAEVLMVNSAVRSLIREGNVYQLESIMQTSRGEGTVSMKRSIQDLIDRGEVHESEINKMNLIE